MKQRFRLENEDGAVLVVALMMLVLLTILGISISSTSEVEQQIAGNERRYKENLYMAEAAGKECIQIMEEMTLDELDPSIVDDWLIPLGDADETDIRSDSFWEEDPDTDQIIPGTPNGALENTQFVAIFMGDPGGEEIGGLREYAAYGRTVGIGGSRSIVRIGYLRPGDSE
jgi:hypothetical protein